MKFVDIQRSYGEYKDEIDRAVHNVLSSGNYIGDYENKKSFVYKFSREVEKYLGCYKFIPCASGTMALMILYTALRIDRGSAVISPDFNFMSAAEVCYLFNVINIFADVDDNFLVSKNSIIKVINGNGENYYRIKALAITDMFGQLPDFKSITDSCPSHWYFIEDAAQSFGASNKNKKAGTFLEYGITSFYPAKPFGGIGEGGGIILNVEDPEMYERIKQILNHGMIGKYDHALKGMNGRMDQIQAAVLSVKLKYLDKEIYDRNRIANMYFANLPEDIVPKKIIDNPSWAQFTLKVNNREIFQKYMIEQNIPVMIHYPRACSQQQVFIGDELPVRKYVTNTDRLCNCVISLPMHPWLEDSEVYEVIKAVNVSLNRMKKVYREEI